MLQTLIISILIVDMYEYIYIVDSKMHYYCFHFSKYLHS